MGLMESAGTNSLIFNTLSLIGFCASSSACVRMTILSPTSTPLTELVLAFSTATPHSHSYFCLRRFLAAAQTALWYMCVSILSASVALYDAAGMFRTPKAVMMNFALEREQ